jgi:hypothetical protein
VAKRALALSARFRLSSSLESMSATNPGARLLSRTLPVLRRAQPAQGGASANFQFQPRSSMIEAKVKA